MVANLIVATMERAIYTYIYSSIPAFDFDELLIYDLLIHGLEEVFSFLSLVKHLCVVITKTGVPTYYFWVPSVTAISWTDSPF